MIAHLPTLEARWGRLPTLVLALLVLAGPRTVRAEPDPVLLRDVLDVCAAGDECFFRVVLRSHGDQRPFCAFAGEVAAIERPEEAARATSPHVDGVVAPLGGLHPPVSKRAIYVREGRVSIDADGRAYHEAYIDLPVERSGRRHYLVRAGPLYDTVFALCDPTLLSEAAIEQVAGQLSRRGRIALVAVLAEWFAGTRYSPSNRIVVDRPDSDVMDDLWAKGGACVRRAARCGLLAPYLHAVP